MPWCLPIRLLSVLLPALSTPPAGVPASAGMALPVVCVEECIADRLVSAIADAARKSESARHTTRAANSGPLVTDSHRARVVSYIEKGITEGARARA